MLDTIVTLTSLTGVLALHFTGNTGWATLPAIFTHTTFQSLALSSFGGCGMGSLVWRQIDAHLLRVGETIPTEPFVASVTPSVGEAVRTASNQNWMLSRNQLGPLRCRHTRHMQRRGAQHGELNVRGLSPDGRALGRTVAPITSAGTESHSGYCRAKEWDRSILLRVVSWTPAQCGVEGDDSLTFLEDLSPAFLETMLEEFSGRTVPFILTLLWCCLLRTGWRLARAS